MGPSLILTGQYFDVRRGIANGFHVAAASLGALVFSPAISYFINTYHLKGALLILAGLAFHVVPAGMLLRPPGLYEKWARRRRLKNSNITVTKTDLLIASPDKGLQQNGTSQLNEYRPSSLYTSTTLIPSKKPKDAISVHSFDIPKHSKGVHFYSNGNICDRRPGFKEKIYGSADMIMVIQYGLESASSLKSDRKSNSLLMNDALTEGYEDGENIESRSDYQEEEESRNTRNFFSISVFKNASYVFFAIGFTLGVPVVISVVYLPDVAKDCGIPSDEAALLVSIYMVGEIIGRCGSGLFSGKRIHRQIVIAWSLLIAGIAQNLVRFLLTFWLLAIFAFVNGVFGGPIHGLYASVVADILGVQNLRSGLCVLQMSQGVIWSVILPITGKDICKKILCKLI
jgi:MFS family permease